MTSRALLLVLLAACAAPAPPGVAPPEPDLTSEDGGVSEPDLYPVCADNAPPAVCVASPATERELLNRCVSGEEVTVIVRDSFVPRELWNPDCPLPPL